MADTLLLRALKGNAKSLNFSCKKLNRIPKLIGKLQTVLQIDLKGNHLDSLPPELGALHQLEVLNIGNNHLYTLPECLAYLYSLQTLHLFKNQLEVIPEGIFCDLRNLTTLNLNNNEIVSLPRDICKLSSLQRLSLDCNKLRQLPIEICALGKLRELRISKNKLERLPLEFGFLSSLEELHVPMNRLRELPESIGKCYKLRVLDVAANELRIFPTETEQMPLTELHVEENPLLSHTPVHSIQEEEVLSLKEMVARFVMKSLKDRQSSLRVQLGAYPELRHMLAQSSSCAVCQQPFLNTWLECVRFVKPRKLRLKNTGIMELPIRALLCSYTCFNNKNHEFFGVAFP